ncbi:MAG TPA: ABC-F family ATP-binding cassette domain-containing protein [Gemmatimonadales bacterium]|nr:ABC-F family ATP-binding cassette domain-containing protein [Gemmatimonadales bacterium]
MAILSLSDVAVEFGATTLLKDVTFVVSEGERWGIVGRNGSGKTTLFNLVAGTLGPTRGTIARQAGLRIAMLDQYRDFGDAITVWDGAAQAYRGLMELERQIERQGEHLAAVGDRVTEEDLTRYGELQERFAHDGGYAFHARVDKVLQGLGFDAEESRTRALAGLSGGERGRLGLAAQLAAPADLVLLDEPTNHLDLETIVWLKQYLGEFGETVMVISHDRAFLDDTVDHVLHISARTAVAYRGGYSAFVTQREERRLALDRQIAKQDKLIAKQEDYIRRNMAGRMAAQAAGRKAILNRLPRLSAPPGESEAMSLRLDISARGGDQALVTDKLGVTIGDRVLLRGFSSVARRGDVIALVGPNGVGKTTLLATLLGQRAPSTGTARLGAGVEAEWFRQDLSQIPVDKTIYDCIADVRPMWNRGAIQNHLGAFGFSGDEVQRNTGVLSGGERARVALALMTLRSANLLVLDEPTNHLDVESIEAVEDAIEEYEGTVILVSHDRAFLRELSTRVWAFDGGRIEDYGGPFVEWELHAAERKKLRDAARLKDEQAARTAVRSELRKNAAGRKEGEDAQRAGRREAAAREADVHRLEARVSELATALADPALYNGAADGARKAGQLDRELKETRRALEDAMARWTEAAEALD